MQAQLLNIDYNAIRPELIITFTGIVVLLYGTFQKQSQRELMTINLLGSLSAGISCFILWKGNPLSAFSGMIVVDHMSLAFNFIFLIVAALTSIASLYFVDDENHPPEEYYSLIMFATVGMMLMAAAGDMVMIFLGLEIASISTYVMAGYRRTDLRSNESALKYFILGSFSTAFLLYGIALVYGATGSCNLETIRNAVKGGINFATNQPLPTDILYIGVGLLLVGFAFKIASVPFHFWTPDVYEGAPTPVTAFMATASKAAAFAAFIRVFPFTFTSANSFDLHNVWVGAIQLIAILTMVVGNVAALAQSNIKRMLAYSSIAHAGYILLGFLADDWGSVAFYLLSYSLMNIGAFAVISVFAGSGDERTEIDSLAGLGFKHLGLSLALLVFMLSMAGVPLTGGFIGKFAVFRAAWEKGFQGLVIVAVLNSAASVFYYLRPMVVLFFRENEENKGISLIPASIVVAVILALLGTFYLGIMPSRVLDILEVGRQSIAVLR